MAKRKHYGKKKTERSYLEILKDNGVNIVSIALGIVAIVIAIRANSFSKDANEIARQQLLSNVVLLNDKATSARFETYIPDIENETNSDRYDIISCTHQLRFSNLGAVKDSIVSFDTLVSYMDTSSMFEGYDESTGVYVFDESPFLLEQFEIDFEPSDRLHNAINWLYVSLVPENAPQENLRFWETYSSLELPLAIEGYETIDTEVAIAYNVLPANKYYLINQFSERPTGFNGEPLFFELLFHLTSGEIVRTPAFDCGEVEILD